MKGSVKRLRIRKRKEDEADKWLRENDPYYTSKRKNKRKHTDYAYETPEQEKRRREMEIPISNLNSSERVQFKKFAGEYDEDGNFNL